MSVPISLPKNSSLITSRGRVNKFLWDIYYSLEKFSGNYLEINTNPERDPYGNIKSPIFTSMEYWKLENLSGEVIIKCNDYTILDKYIGKLSQIEEDLYKGVPRYRGATILGMGFYSVFNTDLTPELYLEKIHGNKITLAQGESINELDLLSTMSIDAGLYSQAYDVGNWYGVIVKQIRKCCTKLSKKTVVTYGSIDNNFVYLYQDNEAEEPAIVLPRYLFFGKPFTGKCQLELCLEPLVRWKRQS